MIISLLSLKGGVAKTTSAVHLATCAAREEKTAVQLIDLDPQMSAVSWLQQSIQNHDDFPFQVNTISYPLLRKKHDERLATIKDSPVMSDISLFWIVDTPPNRPDVLLEVAQQSDFVVIPVAATGLDMDRLRNTLEELAKLDELQVSILLTRFDNRRNLAKAALEALSDYPVFKRRIRNLAKYEQAFATTPKYLTEYWDVWDEIKEMMQ